MLLDYLLTLHGLAGLFNAFTFWNIGNSQIDMQSRLFSIFMTLTISPPLIQQLQPKFLELRNIYESRERNSRIYSWKAFVCGAILPELPWSFVSSAEHVPVPRYGLTMILRICRLLVLFTGVRDRHSKTSEHTLTFLAAWFWPPGFSYDSYTAATVWLFVMLFEVRRSLRICHKRPLTVTGLLRFVRPSDCLLCPKRTPCQHTGSSVLPVRCLVLRYVI